MLQSFANYLVFFILGVFYIPGTLAGFSICGLFFAVYIILFEAPLGSQEDLDSTKVFTL
ncbi:hypothetical protein DSO57_1022580 [Entomophthora muscae]|uniref:Uncharacterized protein n=1 Tax=Entomophthora muscae TaxID=34485 RepID=A0ACC2TEI9_9FUNG|nr:hypothetical protein DSO57_1022580 [Entomophthora muscae]